MDVVNGKIVSARTERSRSDIWSALKPSRGVLLEGPCPYGKSPAHAQPGSFRNAYYCHSHPIGGVHGAPGTFEHQPGWKRSCTPTWGRDPDHKWTSSPSSPLRPPRPASISSSCAPEMLFVSRASLDAELDRCESHVSRAVISRFAPSPSVGKLADAANPLKRPLVELHSAIVQVHGPWKAPLRYLLRKVMSASDVGELGRIVLPKKDAEGKLPQIDFKGKQLEMKDYNFSRSWRFHYKWWVNNKSRMYVLENTGGFIKHHGLEANDSLVVYEDGYGNLVARGQKKLTWIPQLHFPVSSSKSGSLDVDSFKLESFLTSTEDASCWVNSGTNPLIADAFD